MRTTLLALAITAALTLGACSDGSGPSGTAAPGPSPTSTSTGNPFGEAPAARSTFEPAPDHDTVAGDELLYSLDACKVLQAGGVKQVQAPLYTTTCESHYDAKKRATVKLVQAFGDQERYEAERQVVHGVVTYRTRNRDDECDAQMIPTSHTTAIEVEAGYDQKDPCSLLTDVTDKLTRVLTTDFASLQSSTLTSANLPACPLLGQAYGRLASDESLRVDSGRLGQCTVQQADPEYPELSDLKAELTFMLTKYPEPLETEQTGEVCTATGPGWAMPETLIGYSGERGGLAVIEITLNGSCAEASDLYTKVLAAAKGRRAVQQTPSEQNRFWYTDQEADRPVTGSCTAVNAALEVQCRPMQEVTVPTSAVEAFRAAAVDPDVTCAMVAEQVRAAFPDLDQVSTGINREETGCIFSAPATGTERTDLWVGVPSSRTLGFTDSTEADGLESGPTYGLLPGWSEVAGYGVRSTEGAGAFELHLASTTFEEVSQGETQLKPLADALGREVLRP